MRGQYSHSLMLNSSSTLSCLRICSALQRLCLTLYSPLIFCLRLPLTSHTQVIASLKEKRTEDSWRAVWSKAEALCANVGVTIPPLHLQEKRQSQILAIYRTLLLKLQQNIIHSSSADELEHPHSTLSLTD